MTTGSSTPARAFDAVCFDAGNTLLEPEPSVGTTMARVLATFGIERTPAELDAHMPAFSEFYGEVYERDASFWSEQDRQAKMWMDGYGLILERVGIRENVPHLVNAIYNAFNDPRTWRLFDGVLTTFEELHARGYRIGIISNWGSELEGILGGLGLAPYIDALIASAEVGLHKPQPAIFRCALERLGTTAARTVHVGDHPEADVHGAAAVGITPMLITYTEPTMFDPTVLPPTEGVRRITDLRQLLPLLP